MSDAALREQLHGMWASVAAGWDEHADATDDRGGAITERLLARTAPAAGERVLELACGPGGMGRGSGPSGRSSGASRTS